MAFSCKRRGFCPDWRPYSWTKSYCESRIFMPRVGGRSDGGRKRLESGQPSDQQVHCEGGSCSFVHSKLISQKNDFRLQKRMRSERRGHRRKQEVEQAHHKSRIANQGRNCNRIKLHVFRGPQRRRCSKIGSISRGRDTKPTTALAIGPDQLSTLSI